MKKKTLIPVSGSFDYFWKPLASLEVDGHTFMDAFDFKEIWIGDLKGTATSLYPFVTWPSGVQEAWLITNFEGTVLGKYKGTLVIITIYDRPDGTAEWQGRWMIVSGTGDLEYLRGQGGAWGPGSTNEDNGIIDIYYTGQVMFLEPASDS